MIQKMMPVFKDYLWGGEKLKTLFGRKNDGIIAESWEVSIHKDGESVLPGTNKTFSEYLKENPSAVDKNGGNFPVLIKYIQRKSIRRLLFRLRVKTKNSERKPKNMPILNIRTKLSIPAEVCLRGRINGIAFKA